MKKLFLALSALIFTACTDYTPKTLADGTTAKFQRLDITGLKPMEYAPMFYNIISGSPKHSLWQMESADGGITTGVWQSTLGKWRFENEHWEYCRIRSGVSVITEDGGEPQIVRAGDSFVLREGFKGTWEVLETTQKDYIIRK